MTEQDTSSGSRASVRRSLAISFLQKYTSLLIVVPTVIVLSRLLTPAQIGVYSVAAAFVSLVHMLRDFGVSEYLVQERDLDQTATHTAFTVNLLIAWTLALVLFLASSGIAVFYKKAGLGSILQILSINFILLPFISTVNALLQRSMQFGTLYKINVSQQLGQSATTIILAALGYGYFSPAWGSVSGIAIGVLGCMWWGRKHAIRKVSLKNWSRVAQFGVKQTVGAVAWRLGTSAPDFVIGRMLGFSAVGFYSRGYSVVQMFHHNVIGAIRPVALSAFSRDHRETGDAHLLFLKSLTYISAICWPFFLFAALMAFPIIRIAFGDQWNASIPLLRLLAVAALFSTVCAQHGQFLTAIGRVGVASSLSTIIESFRICSLILASFYSLFAVAVSQIFVEAVRMILVCFTYTRYTPLNWISLGRAFLPSVIVSGVTFSVMLPVYLALRPSENQLWLPLLVVAATGVLSWLTALRYVRHPLWFEATALARRTRQWLTGKLGDLAAQRH